VHRHHLKALLLREFVDIFPALPVTCILWRSSRNENWLYSTIHLRNHCFISSQSFLYIALLNKPSQTLTNHRDLPIVLIFGEKSPLMTQFLTRPQSTLNVLILSSTKIGKVNFESFSARSLVPRLFPSRRSTFPFSIFNCCSTASKTRWVWPLVLPLLLSNGVAWLRITCKTKFFQGNTWLVTGIFLVTGKIFCHGGINSNNLLFLHESIQTNPIILLSNKICDVRWMADLPLLPLIVRFLFKIPSWVACVVKPSYCQHLLHHKIKHCQINNKYLFYIANNLACVWSRALWKRKISNFDVWVQLFLSSLICQLITTHLQS